MSWSIEWPKHEDIQSYGRNRGAKATGLSIQVYDWNTTRLILKPINSKGVTTEGVTIEIPLSHLDKLIDQLQAIKVHTGR